MNSTKAKGAPRNGTPSKTARQNCKPSPKPKKDIYSLGTIGLGFYAVLFGTKKPVSPSQYDCEV